MDDIRRVKKVAEKAIIERMVDRVASRAKSALSVGKTVESEKWRLHRYNDSIVITHLENAGKKGKTCQVMTLSFGFIEGNALRESVGLEIMMLAKKNAGLPAMEKALKDLLEEYQGTGAMSTGFELSVRQEKGVRVVPAGFGPIEVKTKNIWLRVEMNDFSVRDMSEARRLKEKREDGITQIRMDHPNEPTCIPSVSGSKAGLPVFYRWVKDNEAKLKSMTYSEVLRQISSLGIDHHTYCAMD